MPWENHKRDNKSHLFCINSLKKRFTFSFFFCLFILRHYIIIGHINTCYIYISAYARHFQRQFEFIAKLSDFFVGYLIDFISHAAAAAALFCICSAFQTAEPRKFMSILFVILYNRMHQFYVK